MIAFVADENFNGDVITALRRRYPDVDIVSVHQLGLSGSTDLEVLEWAAQNQRVVLSNDVQTMIGVAVRRISEGKRMPGLIEIRRHSTIPRVVEDLAILSQCSDAHEWEGQVIYIPM